MAASTCLYVGKKHCKIPNGVILSISKKRILTNAFPLNPCNPSITKRLVLNQINLFSSSFNLKTFQTKIWNICQAVILPFVDMANSNYLLKKSDYWYLAFFGTTCLV